MNSALHMIAVTPSRGIGSGAIYQDKLTTGGKTRTEAIRLLRRRISDAVYTARRADERHPVSDSASQPRRPAGCQVVSDSPKSTPCRTACR